MCSVPGPPSLNDGFDSCLCFSPPAASKLQDVWEDQGRLRGGDAGGRDDPGHLGAHQGEAHPAVPGAGPAQVRRSARARCPQWTGQSSLRVADHKPGGISKFICVNSSPGGSDGFPEHLGSRGDCGTKFRTSSCSSGSSGSFSCFGTKGVRSQ